MHACVVGGGGVVRIADWVQDVHVRVPGLSGQEGGSVGVACWGLLLGGWVEEEEG